jgi:menaquinone-dependent protoporphyrinogen IX oxidase
MANTLILYSTASGHTVEIGGQMGQAAYPSEVP